MLINTGKPRSSGISNWDMLKRHLDGDVTVRDAMDGVFAAYYERWRFRHPRFEDFLAVAREVARVREGAFRVRRAGGGIEAEHRAS